jgi:hypothetical protein
LTLDIKTRVENLEKLLARERNEIEAQPEKRNALYVKTLAFYLSTVKNALVERVRQVLPTAAGDDDDDQDADDDDEGGDGVEEYANVPIFQRKALEKQKRLYDLVVVNDENVWMDSNRLAASSIRSSFSSGSSPSKQESLPRPSATPPFLFTRRATTTTEGDHDESDMMLLS